MAIEQLSKSKKLNQWCIIILLLLAIGLSGFKIFYLGFTPRNIVPSTLWTIELSMSLEAGQEDVSVRSFLPVTDYRQKVNNIEVRSEYLSSTQKKSAELNRIRWEGENIDKLSGFGYKAQVEILPVEFTFPNEIGLEENGSPPNQKSKWIVATKKVQSSHKEIKSLVKVNKWKTNSNVIPAIEGAFTWVRDSIKNTNFSGETDALLALRLREASCNGKSRLLVAMLRSMKLPTRLVGGVILDVGQKRTIHQWVEVWIGNHWVPMDPLNNHLFKIPENYLKLYVGDLALIKRKKNQNFQYHFNISKKLHPKTDFHKSLGWLDVSRFLQNAGVDTGLLGVLLLIPVGAVVTVIFRNTIGFKTFGTFLPALIASSFRDTGIWWGFVGFSFILLCGYFVRKALDKLGIMHTPKVTILLAMVISLMLVLTLVGAQFDIKGWQTVALYPVAILALTVERFSSHIEEGGYVSAILKLLQTFIVTFFCYVAMMSPFLQGWIVGFPETILVVVAFSLYLGRWTGLRLSEFWRFKKLGAS